MEAGGDIVARLPGAHAEVTVLAKAAELQLTPRMLVSVWNICGACKTVLTDAKATLTGLRSAVWKF